MAEAAKSVAEHCGEKIIYISVANNLSVDCDCDASPEDPKMGDIGILASLDPVALDKACTDLVRASEDHGKSTSSNVSIPVTACIRWNTVNK